MGTYSEVIDSEEFKKGVNIGIDVGIKQSRLETYASVLRNLMRNQDFLLVLAMDAIGVPKSDRKKIGGMLADREKLTSR